MVSFEHCSQVRRRCTKPDKDTFWWNQGNVPTFPLPGLQTGQGCVIIKRGMCLPPLSL